MTIASAIVDLTAVQTWPLNIKAVNEVHMAVDRWYWLRMTMGAALAPAEIKVFPITPGRLMLLRVRE